MIDAIWNFLGSEEDTAFSLWVREGYLFDRLAVYYVLLMIHEFGMAIIVGVSFVITAKLFGMGRGFPTSEIRRLLPLGWLGFYINLISGTALFLGQPRRSILTVMYDFKMLFVLSACLLLLVLGRAVRSVRLATATDGTTIELVPDTARVLALSATILWLMAVAAGRIIGYTEPPPV